MSITFIGIIIIIAISLLGSSVLKVQGQVKGIKYTLDQIAEKVQVDEKPINETLRELINEEKDVEAVKVARETLGLTLVEGKQYVDALKASSQG